MLFPGLHITYQIYSIPTKIKGSANWDKNIENYPYREIAVACIDMSYFYYSYQKTLLS